MKFSEIVLFGMPNSGKSTVFNALTGGNAKVGNWHGVTVDVKEGRLKGNKGVAVCDLPGVYSLYPVTLEEKIAIDKAVNTSGLIVAVIEAKTLNIALESVFSLIRSGKRVLIAVNMVKELSLKGGNIDFNGLKKVLPAPIVCGEFNTKKGISALLEAIENYSYKSVNAGDLMFSSSGIKNYFTPSKRRECFFDKLALSNVFGYFIFLFIFVIAFYLAFGSYGLGKPISNFLDKYLIQGLSGLIEKLLFKLGVSEFLTRLVLDGVIGGLGGIFVFLPQTIILFFILNVLELTGYMARVAYLFDSPLKNTGLNGRAVFSELMGLGCTAVAVLATNGLENETVKKRAVLSSGMVCCSAKIPALMLISASVANLSEFSFMILVYLFGTALFFLQLKLSNKIIKGKRVPLILELPEYRLPRLRDLLGETFKTVKGFALKICTVIFIISVTLFLLKSLTPAIELVRFGYEGSLLYYLGAMFKWIFIPIGVDDWRLGSAMISGIFAKEGIASTILALYDGKLPYAFSSVMAIATFFYVYTPCITALATVSESLGVRFSIRFALLQFIEALITAYLTYYFLVFPLWVGGALGALTVVITGVKILKRRAKSL